MNPGRYHRQAILPVIGEAGQAALGRASVVIVGCGALGCASADLLARAGVGNLRLIDRDVVEWTNLQRQVLFDEDDARQGTPKAVAAAARLGRVNSSIRIEPVVADVNARNAERLLVGGGASAGGDGGMMILLDGTDNFQTRYLLNDVAVKHQVPYVYGGVVGTHGMSMAVVPERGPCLRCVFPDPPAPGSAPTCDTAGVLGAAVAVVSALQVAEAMKLIVGGEGFRGGVLTEVDLWRGVWRRLDVSGAARSSSEGDACPCCGQRRFEFLEATDVDGHTALCGADAVQVMPAMMGGKEEFEIDLGALAGRLRALGTFTLSPHMLRGRLDDGEGREGGVELSVFRDGRAIIRGTTDPARARTLYARYVGA